MILDDNLAKIVRPIVEGQIRSFLHDHPVIAEAVDWRFSQSDKVEALVASIGKRINRDLLSDHTRQRIEAVIASCRDDGKDVEAQTASEDHQLEVLAE